MIILEALTANAGVGVFAKPFLTDVDLVLPSDRRIALIGTDYEQTLALMNLLSGLLPARTGRVIRQAKVSFPVGYLGGFSSDLPVRQNIAHLARLYGADVEIIVRFVRRAVKLGAAFEKPYAELPKDARQNLGTILAYALPFDTYLLQKQPKAQSGKNPDTEHELFEARRRTAGMIIPTSSKTRAAEHCEMGLIFAGGTLRLYNSLDEAFNSLSNAGTSGSAEMTPREERKLATRKRKRKLARRDRAMQLSLVGEGSPPNNRTG